MQPMRKIRNNYAFLKIKLVNTPNINAGKIEPTTIANILPILTGLIKFTANIITVKI